VVIENNEAVNNEESVKGDISVDGDSIMNEDKKNLKKLIQKWVINDNEMRALNAELKKKKELNAQYTKELMTAIKRLEIQTVDINNGYISYVQRNQKKPITKKYLTDIFTKYYSGNKEEADRLNNYINENREITTKEILVRKINVEKV
jgi:CxxC motif-containing protein